MWFRERDMVSGYDLHVVCDIYGKYCTRWPTLLSLGVLSDALGAGRASDYSGGR